MVRGVLSGLIGVQTGYIVLGELRYSSSNSRWTLNDRSIALDSMTRRGFVAGGVAVGALAKIPLLYAAQQAPRSAAFSFGGTEYFYRWSNNVLFEFTPHGQSDLDHWSDMVSVLVYRNASDANGLLNVAKTVLATNKQHNGVVLSTHSTPSTPAKPAEYYMCVVLGNPNLLESVFSLYSFRGSVMECSTRTASMARRLATR